MESKSLFLKSSADVFECLGVIWLKEKHEGTPGTDLCSLCHKGMDFIPNLLLGKTLCDKGYSLFISAQHIVKH